MTYYLIYMVIGIAIVIADVKNVSRAAFEGDDMNQFSQTGKNIIALIVLVGSVLTWPMWFAYRVKHLFQRLTKKKEEK